MAKLTAAERQAALDNIPEADLAKIQAKTKGKIKVATEDIIEAEFLMKFGWEAYWSLYPDKDRKDGITGSEMARLITASRKVDAQNMYRNAQVVLVGTGAANAKSPSSAFDKSMTKVKNEMKADL